MGLSKYRMASVGVIHLRDAEDEFMYAEGGDGQPDKTKPRRVHVYGPGTDQYAKAQTRYKNALVQHAQRKNGRVKLTADEERLLNAEFLTGITKGFENIESENGKVGDDLFMEIYMDKELSFIPSQVESYARDTANFKPASSKN